MKNGFIVYNSFLYADKFGGKFSDLTRRFICAAEKYGITLTPYKNSDMLFSLNGGEIVPLFDIPYEWGLFWDKDVYLARRLEAMGIKLYNCADTVEVCDDKIKTHIALAKENIPFPETISAPLTFDTIGYSELDFLETAAERLGFPMVVKECYGSFGWQVYLAKGMETLKSILAKTAPKPVLFQKFIKSSKGRDVRVNVVGGEVICALLRTNDSDFRANLTLGGEMERYELSAAEKELAVKSANAVNADFAGVDLLFGKDEPLVCEINSNLNFKTTYECTGIDLADIIINRIKEV